jgi:hypothetical protein
MPELENFSPFPNFRYYSLDNKGQEFGIIIVKATYEIDPDGRLLLAEEQAPMVFSDKFNGALNVSSLWHPSDLVPNKPKTDVIVNAIARAPDGEPRARWECGLQIERDGAPILTKLLRVCGARQWLPKWKRRLDDDEQREWRRHVKLFERWELSEPEPIAELPLHYEYAFGGLLACGGDKDGKPIVDDIHCNPIGRGWLDKEWTDHTQPQRAPQIELAGDPIREPYKIYAPQSLGPIPCAWEPRLPLGGTYDQNWIDKVWPNWPEDYSLAYHNSAHPDLICADYLRGDEVIRLLGFWAEHDRFDIALPGDRLAVMLVRSDGEQERVEMNLDTLLLDIAESEISDARVYVSWRVNFPPNVYEKAAIDYVPGAENLELMKETFAKEQIEEKTR